MFGSNKHPRHGMFGLCVGCLGLLVTPTWTTAENAAAKKSSAAAAFVEDLFESPLRENWKVRRYSWSLSKTDFARLQKDDAALRDFIGDKFAKLFDVDSSLDQETCSNVAAEFRKSKTFLDRYPISFHGKYAFALWFMKFDQDNWFTFEKILAPIEKYLDGTEGELVLVKRVKPIVAPLLRTNGIFTTDLPIVLSRKEGTMTIFAVELFD